MLGGEFQGQKASFPTLGITMTNRFPCTFHKACFALYLYQIANLIQTEIAIRLALNVGTVNHVVHRRCFRNAVPIRPLAI